MLKHRLVEVKLYLSCCYLNWDTFNLGDCTNNSMYVTVLKFSYVREKSSLFFVRQKNSTYNKYVEQKILKRWVSATRKNNNKSTGGR